MPLLSRYVLAGDTVDLHYEVGAVGFGGCLIAGREVSGKYFLCNI